MSGSSPFNTYIDGYGTEAEQTSEDTWDNEDNMFSAITFQMPDFLTGAPKLAFGGGAEVLSGSSAAWMNNSGFSGYTNEVEDQGPSIFKSTSFLSDDFAASQPQMVTEPLLTRSGMPMYSASGIDVLSILSRVVTRPNPAITLGPVDLTCAFLITDTRRFDSPIVYISPSFTQLTGYTEGEVVGRNCRFLQSPSGLLEKGAQRIGGNEQPRKLWKAIENGGECQVQLVNYKKGGQPFINLVTLIPVRDTVNTNETAYYVGFQVDVNRQPSLIMERLQNGTYSVPAPPPPPVSAPPAILPASSNTPIAISKDLKKFFQDRTFTASLPITHFPNVLSTTCSTSASNLGKPEKVADTVDGLHLMLLESCPDIAMVLSLKGAFLYVGPSVRRILGYESSELVNKSVEDICHPADVVPLMRELKESSGAADGSGIATVQDDNSATLSKKPRSVDIVVRVRAKDDRYVWLECTGRMHVEPGKGRKAVILSARPVAVPDISMGSDATTDGAVFTTLSEDGIFLLVSSEAHRRFGYQVGMDISSFVPAGLLERFRAAFTSKIATGVVCELHNTSDNKTIPVEIIFRHTPGSSVPWIASTHRTCTPSTAPIVCQINPIPTSGSAVPKMTRRVYEELDVARGSSWQYEIQQMRIANERLLEEMRTLEKTLPKTEPGFWGFDEPMPMSSSTFSSFNYGSLDMSAWAPPVKRAREE